jgi:hypothetical protein
MTASKQLLRISGGQQKLIAPNVNRTGYAKIAELVEMPDKADIP